MNVLADFPAYTVLALADEANIQLDNDKGYARTSTLTFRVKSFPKDKYEYLRSFTIGCDGDNADNVWAFGNGSTLTAEARSKEYCAGIELGQVLTIEYKQYRVDPAPNKNIKLVAL